MAEYSCHLTQVASLSTATEISLDILSVTYPRIMELSVEQEVQYVLLEGQSLEEIQKKEFRFP